MIGKRLALVVAAVMAAAIIAASAWAGEREAQIQAMSRAQLRSGAYAPDFALPLLDGGEFRVADNVGKKVIVLNFFASWCAPCILEMPGLAKYYDKHREEPFVIIGVDVKEREQKARDFIEARGVTFPVVLDSDGKISKLYGVHSLPATVVIGADGTVKAYIMGMISDAAHDLDQPVGESIKLIKEGKGIDKKTYLEKLGQQDALVPAQTQMASR